MIRFLAGVLCGFPLFGSVANLYIAQSAAGTGLGANCANAAVYTFFNTAGNWGAGASQIGPGSTVHVCGTLTASAGASGYLAFQDSGTAGNTITLLMETGAILTATYWGANGAIFGNGQSYITIDGGTNGIIRATDNGTALGNQQNGAGIQGGEGSNLIVKNFTVGPIYTRTGTTDQLGQDTFGIITGNGTASNHIRVTNNTVHDMKWAIFHSFRAGVTTTDLEQDHNNIYNMDHGIFDGTGNTNAIFTVLRIHDNLQGDMVNWDDLTIANVNHHDPIHINGHMDSSILDVWVYNNKFVGDAGQTTNAFFYTYPDPGTYNNWYLFNNVCNPTGSFRMANGCFAFVNADAMHVWNNTGVSGTDDIGIHYLTSTNGDFKNNIFQTVGTLTVFISDDNTPGTLNYDVWYSGVADFKINGVFYPDIAALQGIGFEANGTATNPSLNGSYVPATSGSADATGTNLTASCATVSPLCSDLNGDARPAMGAWDIGAVNSAGGTGGGSTISGKVTVSGRAAVR